MGHTHTNNGFFKLVEALPQINSCFFSHSILKVRGFPPLAVTVSLHYRQRCLNSRDTCGKTPLPLLEVNLWRCVAMFLFLCRQCVRVLYVWAWASAERFPGGGNVDILLIGLLTMQCTWMFTKRFTPSTPQINVI